MDDNLVSIAELDERIAALTENLRELVEQAAAYSGAADEELASQRISEQQAQLDLLRKQRDELSRRSPARNP
jgi:C4-dicarboxylate-specific signal transduction histidine kinase